MVGLVVVGLVVVVGAKAVVFWFWFCPGLVQVVVQIHRDRLECHNLGHYRYSKKKGEDPQISG